MNNRRHEYSFGSRLKHLQRKLHMSDWSVRLLVTFVCLLLVAKLIEINVLFPRFDDKHARKIQNIFIEKEQRLHQYMNSVELCTAETPYNPCFIQFHTKYEKELKKHGLYVFAYQGDSLIYWSTKDVVAPESYAPSEFNKPYISLGNGRYASFVQHRGDFHIIGLVLIKNVYTYENKYLKTSFQKDYRLPDNTKISPEQSPGSHPITDNQRKFVWSLIFDSTCHYQWQTYVPALIYLLAVFVFFLLLDSIFVTLRSSASKNLYFLLLALLLLGVRYLMQRWQIPGVFYQLEIFSPYHFGATWFPSLGQLGLWSIFIAFFVLEIYRYLRFPLFYEHRWKYFAYAGVSLAVVIVGFFAINQLLRTLVIDSSGIFEDPNRALLLNWFSFFGYVIIMFFMASFCLLLDKTVMLCKQEMTFSQFLISYVLILSLVVIGWSLAGLYVSLLTMLFLSVMIYFVGIVRLKKPIKLKYSHYILVVFVLSLFTSLKVNQYSSLKYEDQKKVIVTALSSQRDLAAESLFKEVTERIIADTTTLVDLVYEARLQGSTDEVVDYLKRQQLYSSYWNRYIISQCIVSSDNDILTFQDTKRKVNCINYFNQLTRSKGTKVSRSQFWYIDRTGEGDVSSYLGWFRKEKGDEPPLQLFIELRLSGVSDEVGYPELLLDSRTSGSDNLKGYSYAKYRNNNRIEQYGDYRYNLKGDIFQINQDIFQIDQNVYHTVLFDGMEHLIYRPDKNNMIVLSTYSPKPSDLIINFSYIFIFFFLVVSIGLLIFYLPLIRRGFQWNFRNKIQYSMIAIILVSFAIVGVGTVFYINRQYQNKNNDIINEKMHGIHAELLYAIIFERSMDNKWEEDDKFLYDWMTYFRKRFFIDVNLFNVDGQLIATSLPDIFDKGLVGRQINPDAYIQLAYGQRASILEREEIGGLHYISAYEPFVDNENKVIAFLNLPYFTQQDALTEEIYNVIMAMTNFYMVIILLTVIVSVMMSNQISQPLIMLQEKFRSIKLGEKNEPIRYEGHDEVGGLVKEYNRAIEELSRSAVRLARSERESAWREMAKQIAHEINNPLTPMKLSIQHLKRAYDNRSERFDDYMEKISRSLVEQIDTLSSIATEFSNFAKMPAPQNEQIDIIAKINNVVPLFAIDENKRAFHADFHGLERAMIYADKEQISRVFINLFKNALQAIPKDRQAEILIDVLRINQIIWIRIKDNGLGIPEEMQEKIFRPNFTTKSSGMGVGLSIVRNIIESAGGNINFKTRPNEGTTFIISLPSAE